MSTFIYSTQDTLDGPWIVDHSSLKQLGAIIESISEKFENANNDLIEASVASELKNYTGDQREEQERKLRSSLRTRYGFQKKISTSLTNSKTAEDQSIDNLLTSHELIEESPQDLRINIKSSKRSARITFKDNQLSINTTPETDELAREAYVQLQQWAKSNQPPSWQRIWVKNYSGIFLSAISLIFFIFILFSGQDTDINQSLKPAAQKLLKDGITEKQIPQAIELLLRHEFKQPYSDAKPKAKNKTPLFVKIISFGGFAALAILFIRPPLLLGIGRNEKKIRYWRTWIKFIGITIPTFLLSSIVLPYLLTTAGIPH